MKDYIKDNMGKTTMGFRDANGNTPPFIWQRDLANCLGPLCLIACRLTEQSILNDKASVERKAKLKHLDNIMGMYTKMYTNFREGFDEGCLGFDQMFEYIQANKEAQEVYNRFNAVLVSTFFTFMPATKSLAVASPETITQHDFQYSSWMTLMSALKPKSRRKLMDEFQKHTNLSETYDLTPLIKEIEKYLDELNQERKELNG